MFGDRASRLALAMMDDGDDLHITASFRPSEENSSIVGNSSVMPHPMPPSPSSTKASDDDSLSGKQPGPLDSSKDIKLATKRILRTIPSSLARNLRPARKLLSRKFSLMVARQRQQRGIEEYHEFDEKDSPTEANSSVDDISVHSIRSSRVNVATDRSFLVRQKAQVVGRPSVAYVDWENGSVSSGGSHRSRRSLAWDNTSKGSIGDISHLTGDSFRSKHSGFSMSRAMYISTGHSLLGESEESENDLDDMTNGNFFGDFEVFDDSFGFGNGFGLETVQEEDIFNGHGLSPSYHDGISPPIDGRSDNGPVKTGTKQTDHWEMFSSFSTDVWSDFGGSNRQRFFSESDVVYACQHERSKGFDSESKNSSTTDFNVLFQDFATTELDSGRPSIRARTYSDSVVVTHISDSWEENLQAETKGGNATRNRLMSDPQLDSFAYKSELSAEETSDECRPRLSSDGDVSPTSGTPLVRASPTSRVNDMRKVLLPIARQLGTTRRSQGRRFSTSYTEAEYPSDEESHVAEPALRSRGRLHSDSDVSRLSKTFDQMRSKSIWRQTLSPKQGGGGGGLAVTGSGKSSDNDVPIAKPCPVGESSGGQAPQQINTQERIPFESLSRLSSPDAQSAARMIATNLRPAACIPLPSRNPKLNEYYWNSQGSDGDPNSPTFNDVLWSFSSDSFDDIL